MSDTGASGIVGRERELAAGRAALRRVAGASGHALLITGEAGIGKSRLVAALVEEPGERARVFAEAASPLETNLPFAPLVRALGLRPDAADHHAAAVGELVAEPSESDPDRWRLRVIEGIADLVERSSLDQPVVLVVEDLHWADDATLQTLDRLVRRLDSVGALVLCTARPHPRPEALAGLLLTLAQVEATAVELSPLDESATLDLARGVLGLEPGPNLARALVQAGGNPLYLTELLLAADRQLDRERGVADLPSPGVPDTVRVAILRNLSPLPQATVELLRTASVLGTRFDLRQLALTVELPETEVVERLDPALASGVLVASRDRLAFRHDLVREAVYVDQPEAVRAARHRTVVERLRAVGLPPADVVPHLLRGDWRGVPEAVGWLAEAGRALRGRSLPVALELFERALDLAGEDADPGLRLDLVEALALSARVEEATAQAAPLLAVPAGALPREVRDRMVVAVARSPAPPLPAAERHRLLDELETAGLSEAGGRRAELARAWLHWTAGERDAAEEIAAQAAEAAAAARDHEAACMARLLLARLAEGRGSPTMIEHARSGLEHARALPSIPALELDASTTLAIMLGSDAETRDEAEQVVDAALALATRTGLDLFAGVLEGVAAMNAQRGGAWEDAAVRFEAALDILTPVEHPAVALFVARAARLAVHRDELDLAAERVATARGQADLERATAQERDEFSSVYLAEAELRLALGDRDSAVASLDELAVFNDARGTGVYHVITLPSVTAVAWQADRPDAARQAVERAEAWLEASHWSDQYSANLVGWGRARVEGDAATLDRLVAWADGPVPLWEWRPAVREDAAAVLVDRGDRERAVQRLEEALGLWESAGARRDVARARQALRDLGVRRGRGLAADRPTTGWGSLTDAEWRVVALVGEGLTYREIGERLFISRRTVETHVARVFGKLDVSSRRELTAQLRTREGQASLAARR